MSKKPLPISFTAWDVGDAQHGAEYLRELLAQKGPIGEAALQPCGKFVSMAREALTAFTGLPSEGNFETVSDCAYFPVGATAAPDVVKAWLNVLQVALATLEENEDESSREVINRLVERIMTANDIVTKRSDFERIAWKSYAEHKQKSKEGGQRNKRSVWAEMAAEKLKQLTKGLKKEEAWKKLPTSNSPWDFEGTEHDFTVYRDGDYICAADYHTQQPLKRLKKSVFLKNYFSKSQKSG